MITNSVIKVGDGRGFVVKSQNRFGFVLPTPLAADERIIITAAHCLPHLPTCHPARNIEEETYPRLLGPLSGKRTTVWASCIFADPVADIAVLCEPDNQELYKEAEAYNQLVESVVALAIADAPAMGSERSTFGEHQADRPTPGEGPARVLSLDGHWLEGKVSRQGMWLSFEPGRHFAGGMSGSPIIDATSGAAIGIVSVDFMNPVIVDTLSAQLIRSILASQAKLGIESHAA
jgi:hypothetical protein